MLRLDLTIPIFYSRLPPIYVPTPNPSITRCIKNSNLRKEVGIAIKSKETSSQFESVRNSYVAIIHQPVTVCSTM